MRIAQLSVLAAVVALAPLAHGQVAGGNHLSLISTEGDIEGIPKRGDFTLSGGGAVLFARAEGVGITAYGGFLAGDYFVANALSLRVEFIAGTASSAGFRSGEIAVDGGARFYPLQLTDASQCWLQPFLRAGFGDAFYTATAEGSGFNRSSNPFLLAGGGVDLIFDEHWSVPIGVDYFRTLNSGANATGVLFAAGARYKF